MATILGIVGSLRQESFNKKLMQAFAAAAPEGTTLTIAEIGNLPLFNEDVQNAAFPETATALKEQIEAADAIIIATPEYNRNMPGVLKNAIDWASRPYGQNSFEGKPVLVVGASIGSIATALAQYDLKQTMLYLNTRVIGQPEFYLGNAEEKFDAHGMLTDAATKERIVAAWAVLLAMIEA
jgi:chromate reductase